ncbi:AzlD domain-containing protein [Natronospora cellulosivora (SeqCode)]
MNNYYLMIAFMLFVTYLPRVIPLAILSRMQIPDIVIAWLKYIPAAILASLLAPALLMTDGGLYLSLNNISLLAAIPTFIVAIYKKSIFLTVLTGIITMLLFEYIIEGSQFVQAMV